MKLEMIGEGLLLLMTLTTILYCYSLKLEKLRHESECFRLKEFIYRMMLETQGTSKIDEETYKIFAYDKEYHIKAIQMLIEEGYINNAVVTEDYAYGNTTIANYV